MRRLEAAARAAFAHVAALPVRFLLPAIALAAVMALIILAVMGLPALAQHPLPRPLALPSILPARDRRC